MTNLINEETRNKLLSSVSRKVAEGYDDREGLIEDGMQLLWDALDDVDDDDDDQYAVLEDAVEQAVDLTLRAHHTHQASWPTVTDCDRLDAAFADLERAGVIARANFSCCMNCGFSEIGDEIQAFAGGQSVARGFTFFHKQSTARAAVGGGLDLCYGALGDGTTAAVTIGHEVTEVLRRHGLRVEWDGDIGRKIHVLLEWRRRRDLAELAA